MSNILESATVNMNQNEIKSSNDCKILEIASDDKLKKLWSSSIPKYTTIYGLVDVHLRYNIFEGTSLKLFIPIGENFCSLIIAYYGQQMININWDVNKASAIDIQNYLKSLPNIDFNKPITVTGTQVIVDEMKSILKSPGLCWKEQTVEVKFDGDIYAFKGTYERLDVPNGYKLGQLKPEHAAYILEISGKELELDVSEEYLGKQLSKNPSVALYRISDDGDEEQFPVAWTTVRMHGQYIGLTFTIPELRRRGLSRIVKMEIIKIISESGFEPKVAVSKMNTPSITVNQKLGFIKQESFCTIYFSNVEK